MDELSIKKGLSWQDGAAIDQDDENMMQSAIVLRRGRCGRLFAKYVQKSIFEDSDGGGASDADEETAPSLNGASAADKKGKKRRRRYQDLQEYLNLDGSS